MDKLFYTLEEITEVIGKNHTTIKTWMVKGNRFKQYVTKIGGTSVVTVDNLHRYLNNMAPMSQEDK